jgi:hypothetical protein
MCIRHRIYQCNKEAHQIRSYTVRQNLFNIVMYFMRVVEYTEPLCDTCGIVPLSNVFSLSVHPGQTNLNGGQLIEFM